MGLAKAGVEGRHIEVRIGRTDLDTSCSSGSRRGDISQDAQSQLSNPRPLTPNLTVLCSGAIQPAGGTVEYPTTMLAHRRWLCPLTEFSIRCLPATGSRNRGLDLKRSAVELGGRDCADCRLNLRVLAQGDGELAGE